MKSFRPASLERRDVLRFGVGAGSLALCDACARPAACPPIGQWSNAVGTESVRPSLLFFPAGAAEIVAIVRQAEAAGRRIRMTGSGHSCSDVALGDDYLLLPERLDR